MKLNQAFQIIATLGPATEDKIEKLIQAGANAFRLNCSHLTPEELQKWLSKIEIIFRRLNTELPVWLDLQGSKMRIGELTQPIHLQMSQLVTFHLKNAVNGTSIPLPHPEVFRNIATNVRILLDDGRIELRTRAKNHYSFEAEVIRPGILSSYKGFVLRDIEPVMSQISHRDQEFIRKSGDWPFVGYALSFLQNEDEVQLFCQETSAHPIVAKIERIRALSRLQAITEATEVSWLCRGDLGVDGNLFQLHEYEKRFYQQMQTQPKPFVIAGQVLENMVQRNYPSRSEVAHLGYLIENGFSGVVLSDETAVGKYPVDAVRFCAEITNFFAQKPGQFI